MSNRLRRLLLDTNLLLLWVVAKVDVNMLHTFKRVLEFTDQDILLLNRFIAQYPMMVTTPHVLAETSNFIHQAPPQHRDRLSMALNDFVHDVDEIYGPAVRLVDREEFNDLGLTDTGLIEVSNEAMIVTVDHRLAGKITSLGGRVVNFNHARSEFLLARSK